MTQVREQYRNWRTDPLPKDWADDDWDNDVKEVIIQKVIKAIDDSNSARDLWDALNEVYKDFPRRSKGKTGTRLPGEFAEARLLKQQMERSIQAKDRARTRELKDRLTKNNRDWQKQRQDDVKIAAKKDQRFLVDAFKGNFRSQSRVYALQDSEGQLQTSKTEVHAVLEDSWGRIFTANKTCLTDEFTHKFKHLVEEVKDDEIEALQSDFTEKEVNDTLNNMNKNAAALGIPSKIFIKDRSKIAAPLSGFYNRMTNGDNAKGMLDAEILLLPKTENEFAPTERRPIVIAHLIGKCLTRILDVRLRQAIPKLAEQGGFTEELSAEDITATLRLTIEQAMRQDKDLNIFITDWKQMYDSIPVWLPQTLLEWQGVPERLRKLIDILLTTRKVKFRTAFGVTDDINPTAGLAQGDPLSCILAVNVVDLVVRAVKNEIVGVQLRQDGMDAITIKALAYVDDCTWFPNSRDELIKITHVFNDWEKLTGMQLKKPKCRWLYWPSKDIAQKRSNRCEEPAWTMANNPKCTHCGKTGAKPVQAARGDPSLTDPDIRPGKMRMSCRNEKCERNFTAELTWKRNPKAKEKDVKIKLPDDVPFGDDSLKATMDAVKILGITYDPMDKNAHFNNVLRDDMNKLDRLDSLPWAPAEAIAKLEEYVVQNVTYGALSYTTFNPMAKLDALQKRIDD
eukprot:gene1051-940_t